MPRNLAPPRVGKVTPRLSADVVRACMVILVILSISRIHQYLAWLGKLHPGNVLVALPLLMIVMNPRLRAKGWMNRLHTKLMLALVVATLGSIAFGISQGGAFYTFKLNYSSVIVAAFLLFATIRDEKDIRLIAWGFVIGDAILVWMALFVFGMRTEGNVDRLGALYTWDSNDIGLLLVVGLPLTILWYRTTNTLGKIACAAILFGSVSTIALTGSRGAFLGLGAVVLAYLFLVRGVSVASRVVTVVSLAVGLLVAAPKGYWEQMNTITEAESDYNWDAQQGRRQLAKRGMQYMFEHPIFGIGLGQFGRAEATISDRALRWTADQEGIKWSAAHNSFVQAGAELGIPGFGVFVFMVLSCIFIPLKMRRRVPMSWSTGDWEQQFLFHAVTLIPIAVLGFAVSGFFVSFAFNDPIYFLVALAASLRAAVLRKLAATGAGIPADGRQQSGRYGRVPMRGQRGRFGRQPVGAYASERPMRA